jgi:iron(III) transport system substrate-binding protein
VSGDDTKQTQTEDIKMKRKLALLLLLVMVLPFSLAACGGDEGSGDSNTVILYSNAISGGRGDWIIEQAAEAGFDVQTVDAGGVEIANRLLAEANNPQADVVFGLNQMLWFDLVKQDIFEPYVPAWADEVPSELHEANQNFHAVARVINLIAYDLDQIDPADAPTDWLDVWTQFEGRYALPNSLGGSTIQMHLAGIFTRYLDENGTLGVSDEGWAQIEQKFSNGVPTDDDLFSEWINPANNVAMSQIWHMGVAPREADFGVRAGLVVPAIGVPVSVEAVALVNGASNPDAAKRFIDWFGSAEVMNAFALEFNYLPANLNALADLPAFTIEMSNLQSQDINWDVIAERMPQWVEHIYLNYLLR